MAPPVWFPGARRDGRSWTHYGMNGAGGSVRCCVHTTENSQSSTCDGVANYMANNAGLGTGYSLLYHPTTGDMLQLRPFNVGAGSLKNLSGGVETNKNGKYNFQVSVVAYASEDWANKYPCPRWQDLVRWLRDWGVPDRFVSGSFCSGRCTMGTSTWTGSSDGWYGHQHAPENDHVDPGPRKQPWTIGTSGGTPPTQPPTQPPSQDTFQLSFDNNGGTMTLRMIRPTPGNDPSMKGEDVKSWQSTLNFRGFNAGKVDGIAGNQTIDAVKRAQKKYGLAQDGWLGSKTAEALIERA